ncbi:MAG: Na+/H+ antiporter [Dysgonomonas sp.]
MESYSIIIILLAVAIGLFPIAEKFKIPYPVLLLLTGIGVGFIPGFEGITISPEVVFLIFLPPMLYDAAFNIPIKEFRSNLNTISLLAISLVFVTTTGIATVVHFLIPEMSWPLAFVLGAILSPPDAIAASGVTKGLNIPHRTGAILEGESLVNDASALVAFRFAVAAVAGVEFILWKAALQFVISLGGGIFVGWIMWALFALVNKRFRLSSQVIVGLNILIPFVAYLIAEEFHVSGVIAVVTAGLIIAQHKNKWPKETLSQNKSVWDTAIFILGGLIFILIGLEFPQVLREIPTERILPFIGCAFLIFVVALLIRMIVLFWHKNNTERKYRRFVGMQSERSKRSPVQDKRHKQRMKFIKDFEPLKTKDCILLGWSGMRGIVSLAAALSLPLIMDDGSDFPERASIIFLTVVTVIIMLLIQGAGLPVLVKLLKIDEAEIEK